jgi:hypothetical protein
MMINLVGARRTILPQHRSRRLALDDLPIGHPAVTWNGPQHILPPSQQERDP